MRGFLALVLLVYILFWFSLKATLNTSYKLVYITYLGHSLCTPGHPGQLLHSSPSIESPQISPQTSGASSGGSLLGSNCSLDTPFCSRPPTSRSPSVERSSIDTARSYGGNSGYNVNDNVIIKGLKVDPALVQRLSQVKSEELKLKWAEGNSFSTLFQCHYFLISITQNLISNNTCAVCSPWVMVMVSTHATCGTD